MIENGTNTEGLATGVAAPPAALYLLPVPLSDTSRPVDVLPESNAAIIRGLRLFIVENVRSARRFLKRLDPSIDINALTFTVLDEHTPREEVAAMLRPL